MDCVLSVHVQYFDHFCLKFLHFYTFQPNYTISLLSVLLNIFGFVGGYQTHIAGELDNVIPFVCNQPPNTTSQLPKNTQIWIHVQTRPKPRISRKILNEIPRNSFFKVFVVVHFWSGDGNFSINCLILRKFSLTLILQVIPISDPDSRRRPLACKNGPVGPSNLFLSVLLFCLLHLTLTHLPSLATP